MIDRKSIEEKIKELHQSAIYAMSLGSKELFHSNFWAWLMEQDESFVEVFFNDESGKKHMKIGREDGHRDVTLYRKNDENDENCDVYVIENKLKSIATEEQLIKYKTSVEKWRTWKGGVLTGIRKPLFDLPDGWFFLFYRQVAERIMVIAQKSSKDNIKNHIETIRQYCKVLHLICDVLEY